MLSRRTAWPILASALALSGCATTVDEGTSDTTPDGAVTTVAPLTVPEGSTSVLLDRLVEAMTELSATIGPSGGEAGESAGDAEELLVEIEALWSAARAGVEASDSLAALQIDGLVALSRTAVERNRPADADRAARLVADLADSIA